MKRREGLGGDQGTGYNDMLGQKRPRREEAGVAGEAKRETIPISRRPEDRLIISLDLDAFYVAASRKRDPSLVGLPVGIKQKSILATVSYEARALGVSKLCTVWEAKRACPDLVLVDGEDLSYFRAVSQDIWRLIRSIVWTGLVEKLGMDELFCDVTEMVDAHLSHLHDMRHDLFPSNGGSPSDGSIEHDKVWWSLSPPTDWSSGTVPNGAHIPETGFWYDPSTPSGFVLPDLKSASAFSTAAPLANIDELRLRLLLAAHLARHLRSEIASKVGLTCSAGIANSKLLAKIVGNKHKPDQQTVWAPPPHWTPANGDRDGASGSNPDGSLELQGSDARERHTMDFLGPLPIRSLTGFGSSIVGTLTAHLVKHSSSASLLKSSSHQATVPSFEPSAPDFTVASVRSAVTPSVLNQLFKARLGSRLWALLHGRDEEPVTPTSEFPKQLSVEDTYRGLSTREEMAGTGSDGRKRSAAAEELERLGASLLRRLESELTAEEGSQIPIGLGRVLEEMAGCSSPAAKEEVAKLSLRRRHWLRYPRSVRLTIRRGWSSRESRTARMPVGVFDLSIPLQNRAKGLANALVPLLKSLVVKEKGMTQQDEGLNLLNIAAVDLSCEQPSGALYTFFASTSLSMAPSSDTPAVSQVPTLMSTWAPAEAVDLSVLAELPAGVREEMMRQYGIDPSLLRVARSAEDKPQSPLLEGSTDAVKSSGGPDGAIDDSQSGRLVGRGEEEERTPSEEEEEEGTPTPDGFDPPSSDPAQPAAGVRCQTCSLVISPFVVAAHERFHELESRGE